jgi:hypothetical protein
VACNVAASVSTVAPPPVLVLNFAITGSPPKRLSTICAAPVASKNALIAEKTQRHHGHLAKVFGGVRCRKHWRERQKEGYE